MKQKYLLLEDCEIAHYGNKRDCVAFSKRYPKHNFRLLIIISDTEIKAGKNFNVEIKQ